mgnify:CR=1 FL=1
MIVYPQWWGGGYPDIEALLETLFTPLLVGVEPTKWLPGPAEIEATLAEGRGYLRIYRTGGKINRDENRDEPNVQIAALTASRDKSWELIEFVRTGVLEQFDTVSIVPGTIHKLSCQGEVIGPQLVPERMRDDRLVPITFNFFTWAPKGLLSRYRQALFGH